MSEQIKNLDDQVDKLEENVKKYASKDTVISIGGYEFTPAKLMVAFTIVSSILASLYGAFEIYKSYIDMKDKIETYVAPDLSQFDKRLEVIEQNQKATTDALTDSASKTADYTRDIKNDLKQDSRRLEGVVENVERSQKQAARELDQQVKEIQQEMRKTSKDADVAIKGMQREVDQSLKSAQRELDSKVTSIQREVDNKIKQALDNPLANK